MSTATTQPSAYLGTCCWAGHRFRSQAKPPSRLTICPDCEPVTTTAHGRPWTQRSNVKWTGLKARKTDATCDAACMSAKGDKCACECGGENHGAALTGAV